MTRTSNRTAPLLYAGIDEAGYGPRLGPLCTGLSVFEISDWSSDVHAPDLWDRLASVVCTSIRETRHGRIAVADSKVLKRPKGSISCHPLTHLEIGVLSFLYACAHDSVLPQTDAELLSALGAADWSTLNWYGSQSIELPVGTTRQLVHLRTTRLSGVCTECGIRPLFMRVAITDEHKLNHFVETGATKADVALRAVGQLVQLLWAYSSVNSYSDEPPRLVIDRQGGRTHYADVLRTMLPQSQITSTLESPAESRYELVGEHEGRPCALTVHFRVNAEQHHFPVALASMIAKYVRELLMERFNRYWAERTTELKPTAGYGTDAGRWLRDMQDVLSPDERRAIIRRA